MNTFKGIFIGIFIGSILGIVGAFMYLGNAPQDAENNNLPGEGNNTNIIEDQNFSEEGTIGTSASDELNDLERQIQEITTTKDVIATYNKKDSIVEDIMTHDIHSDVDDRKWLLEGLDICNDFSQIDLNSGPGKKQLEELLQSNEEGFLYMRNNEVSSYEQCLIDEECKELDITELDIILFKYIGDKIDKDETIISLSAIQKGYQEGQLTNFLLIDFLIKNLQNEEFSYETCETEFGKYDLNEFS